MDKARQFIKDYTKGCSNELCAIEDRYGKKVISYHEWLTPEQALAAVEIARREVIEKAIKWLNKELPITDLSPSNMLDITFKVFDKECKKEFIEDFKKAMEE